MMVHVTHVKHSCTHYWVRDSCVGQKEGWVVVVVVEKPCNASYS